MGSAAPSLRRWLLVLLVSGGALVAALLIGTRADDPPTLGDAVGDGSGGEGIVGIAATPAEIAVVTATPTAGRTVPVGLEPAPEAGPADAATVTGSDADPDGHDEDGGWGAAHIAERLPAAGTEAAGVDLDVPADAATFVLQAAPGRTLAYRTGGGDHRDPWRILSTGLHEAPDGLPGEEGADAGPPAAAPVPIPAGTTTVEFVVLAGGDEPFDVIYLPAFSGPVDAGFDGPAGPAAAAAGAPAIIPREAWADAGWNHRNSSCDEGPDVSDHLQALVVHHTVNGNDYGPDQVDDLLRSIRYTHTEINGWCDIGYNFVVDRFGRIWEARTGSIAQAVIGGHARGFNTGTVGVALLGQHHAGAWPSATPVSDAARDAVESLAAWKLGAQGVDPQGRTWLRNRASGSPQRLAGETWHHVPTILGHRDLGLTNCPGSHGMDVVGALPTLLTDDLTPTVPYRWTDWRAHDHGPALAVADARGGLRPAGAATPWSQAPSDLGGRAIAAGGDLNGGYLLTASGSLVGYGTAPAVAAPTLVGAAVDLVVRGDGISGWILDGSGTLRGFGGQTDRSPGRPVADPVAAALDDDGTGLILERSGRLVAVGPTSPPAISLPAGAVAIDLDLAAPGQGWVLDDSGRLAGFGGRPDARVRPDAAVVAVVAAPTEPGGWVVDANGQLWPFGGARHVLPVVTGTAANDAVDGSLVGMVIGPEFLDGPDARYVDAIHRLFLGRAPSEVETELGVTALEQGSDRIDLTEPLSRSDHWAGAELDRIYLEVLGREPDPEGRAYWMGEIAGGLKLQDLGTYLYGSGEYARAAGSEENYVRGLYRILLRRDPDAEGLAYWVGELTSGRADPPDIASGFYSSIESRRDRAARLHERIIGSDPSAEVRDALAEQLPATGDAGLAARLAASSDYYHSVVDGPEP